MELGGQRHSPAVLTLGKRPDTQHRGGWLGPQAQSERVGNYRIHRDLTPDVQPLASRYTD